MKKTLLALTLLASSSAIAAPIQINYQDSARSYGGDGTTAAFEYLDGFIEDATSQYFDVDGNSVINEGDVFVDVGSFTSLDPQSPLLGLIGDKYVTNWQLQADYYLFGGVVDTGAGLFGAIAGGIVNVYFDDLANDANDVQVLQLNITGASGGLGGLDLFGEAVYGAWYDVLSTDNKAFVENFFEFEEAVNIEGSTYTSFYDIVEAGLASSNLITLDSKSTTTLQDTSKSIEDIVVNGTAILPEIFGLGAITVGTGSRTETLDINTQFSVVPEPASLAAFGLGLLGLAGLRRKNA